MEVEGDGPHMFGIPRGAADLANGILVDRIDGHVEADIVGSRLSDIVQNGVIGISPDCIMTFPVAVKTHKNQIRFGKIDRKCPVGDGIYNQESRLFGFDDQISQRAISIFPEECFSAAEEEDANAHCIQLPHFLPDLLIRINDRSEIVDRTMPASQIALVCKNHGTQNRISGSEQNGPNPECRQIQKRRWFHCVRKITLLLSLEFKKTDTQNNDRYYITAIADCKF